MSKSPSALYHRDVVDKHPTPEAILFYETEKNDLEFTSTIEALQTIIKKEADKYTKEGNKQNINKNALLCAAYLAFDDLLTNQCFEVPKNSNIQERRQISSQRRRLLEKSIDLYARQLADSPDLFFKAYEELHDVYAAAKTLYDNFEKDHIGPYSLLQEFKKTDPNKHLASILKLSSEVPQQPLYSELHKKIAEEYKSQAPDNMSSMLFVEPLLKMSPVTLAAITIPNFQTSHYRSAISAIKDKAELSQFLEHLTGSISHADSVPVPIDTLISTYINNEDLDPNNSQDLKHIAGFLDAYSKEAAAKLTTAQDQEAGGVGQDTIRFLRSYSDTLDTLKDQLKAPNFKGTKFNALITYYLKETALLDKQPKIDEMVVSYERRALSPEVTNMRKLLSSIGADKIEGISDQDLYVAAASNLLSYDQNFLSKKYKAQIGDYYDAMFRDAGANQKFRRLEELLAVQPSRVQEQLISLNICAPLNSALTHKYQYVKHISSINEKIPKLNKERPWHRDYLSFEELGILDKFAKVQPYINHLAKIGVIQPKSMLEKYHFTANRAASLRADISKEIVGGLEQQLQTGDIMVCVSSREEAFNNKSKAGLDFNNQVIRALKNKITSHSHSGAIYQDEHNKMQIRHLTAKGYEAHYLGLGGTVISEVYRFDPIPLIKPECLAAVKQAFGKNWQEEIRGEYQKHYKKLRENPGLTTIKYDFNGAVRAGLKPDLAALPVIGKLFNANDYNAIKSAMYSDNIRRPGMEKMICSQFEGAALAASLQALDDEVRFRTNSSKPVFRQPLANLQLDLLTPSKFVERLQEHGCIRSIDNPVLHKYFSEKTIKAHTTEIYRIAEKGASKPHNWFWRVFKKIRDIILGTKDSTKNLSNEMNLKVDEQSNQHSQQSTKTGHPKVSSEWKR